MQVLFPSGYRVEVTKLRQQLDEAQIAYWTEWNKRQPEFKIENVRFEHKAGWDKRFFSIQSAHSANHWIWKATRVVWVSMGAASV